MGIKLRILKSLVGQWVELHLATGESIQVVCVEVDEGEQAVVYQMPDGVPGFVEESSIRSARPLSRTGSYAPEAASHPLPSMGASPGSERQPFATHQAQTPPPQALPPHHVTSQALHHATPYHATPYAAPHHGGLPQPGYAQQPSAYAQQALYPPPTYPAPSMAAQTPVPYPMAPATLPSVMPQPAPVEPPAVEPSAAEPFGVRPEPSANVAPSAPVTPLPSSVSLPEVSLPDAPSPSTQPLEEEGGSDEPTLAVEAPEDVADVVVEKKSAPPLPQDVSISDALAEKWEKELPWLLRAMDRFASPKLIEERPDFHQDAYSTLSAPRAKEIWQNALDCFHYKKPSHAFEHFLLLHKNYPKNSTLFYNLGVCCYAQEIQEHGHAWFQEAYYAGCERAAYGIVRAALQTSALYRVLLPLTDLPEGVSALPHEILTFLLGSSVTALRSPRLACVLHVHLTPEGDALEEHIACLLEETWEALGLCGVEFSFEDIVAQECPVTTEFEWQESIRKDPERLQRTFLFMKLVDEQSARPRLDSPAQPESGSETLYGNVVGFYRQNRRGTIKVDSGQVFFFTVDDCITPELVNLLYQANFNKGQTDLKVMFLPSERERSHPRALRVRWEPDAKSIHTLAAQAAARGDYAEALDYAHKLRKLHSHWPGLEQDVELWRKGLKLTTLPKGDNAYAKGKRYHIVEENFEQAEKYYRQAIAEDDNAESAIKDLASMYQQQKLISKGIEFLNKHIGRVEDKKTVYNMLAIFYLDEQRHGEAIEALELVEKMTNSKDRVGVIQRQVPSLIKLQQYDKAFQKLSQAMEMNPKNTTIQEWYAVLRDARKTGDYSEAEEFTIPEGMADFFMDLTVFAQKSIEHCQLEGLRTTERKSGLYAEKDLKHLEDLAKQVGTQRPLQRAEFYLTAAWLTQKLDGDNKRSRDFLRRHFVSKGDWAISENKSWEVVRTFLRESFAVTDNWKLNEPQYTLSKYILSYNLERDKLLEKPPPIGQCLEQVFKRARNYELVFRGLFCASMFSTHVSARLFDQIWQRNIIRKHLFDYLHLSRRQPDRDKVKEVWEEHRRGFARRLKSAGGLLRSLANQWGPAEPEEAFLQGISNVREQLTPMSFELQMDIERLSELENLFQLARSYFDQKHFEDRERFASRIQLKFDELESEIESSASKLAIECIMPFCRKIADVVRGHFEELRLSAVPELTLELLVDSFVPSGNEEIILQFSLTNKAGCATAHDVSFRLCSVDGGLESSIEMPLSSTLRGGASLHRECPVQVTNKARTNQAFTIECTVKYQNRGGETQPLIREFPIRLERDFQRIRNPYAAAGPVEDPDMVYGRQKMLENLKDALSERKNIGKAYIIFGQKRSGKSTILLHLFKALEKMQDAEGPSFVIPVMVDMGLIAESISVLSFLEMILYGVFEEVQEAQRRGFPLPDFPEPSLAGESNRVMAFTRFFKRYRTKCREDGFQREPHFAILIDEFTYLHKSIIKGQVSEDFMKAWKTILDARLFSAALIGQDVMPYFKEQFKNVFARTETERITYLMEEDAKELASRPIELKTEQGRVHRYVGDALDLIIQYSACNPYYIQKICDQLVDYLNNRQASRATRVDVQTVLDRMIKGKHSLDKGEFDNLILPGDAAVSLIEESDYLMALSLIAYVEEYFDSKRDKAVGILRQVEGLDYEYILEDMINRDILIAEGERIEIAVKLFQQWLLCNHSAQPYISEHAIEL